MEAVVFDGKEYIKASVLAEKFRYTQDYLGQLCRGKKVDARLVGRAWYINLESLEEHRSARYKSTEKSTTPTSQKANNNYSSRIDVEPFLKNKTVKIFKVKNGTLSETPVRYEKDEYALIPRVNKTAISASIPILPADAERLKVKKGPKHFNITDFKAQPLPEVFLSGKLKVDGIPEATEPLEEKVATHVDTSDSDITNKIKTERIGQPQRIVSLRQPIKKARKGGFVDMQPVLVNSHQKQAITQISPKVSVSIRKPKAPRPVVAVEKLELKPVTQHSVVKNKTVQFSPEVIVSKKIPKQQTSKYSDFFVICISVLSAVAIASMVLMATQEVNVTKNSYANNFSLSTENISTLFSVFFK